MSQSWGPPPGVDGGPHSAVPPATHPYAPNPYGLPPLVDHFRQRGHTLLIVLVFVTAGLGVAGAGLLSITAGEVEGSGLALLYAMLPVPVLLGCYLWLDRYEPEPWQYKVAAVVWGGVVAITIALALQLAVAELWDLGDKKLATFVAPVTEEPAKCALLLLTFVRSRRVINGVVDGLVYAGLVGLGFAFVENVGYYAGSYVGTPDVALDGAKGATATFVVRGLFSPFAHPLFTSAFGIALGLAMLVRSRLLRVVIAGLGLAASIGLHMAWNGSLTYGGAGWFLVTYLALGVLFAGLVVWACIARMREGRYLLRALVDTSRRGWIHPDEIPYLAQFTHRKGARAYAAARGGELSKKATARYQRLATSMAFLYGGVMDGRPKPNAVPRVFALMDDMHRVKPFVLLPPPIRRAFPQMPPMPTGPPMPSGGPPVAPYPYPYPSPPRRH